MKLHDLPLEDKPYLLDEHGPIFILGCPRSGTTFLSNCISFIPGTEEFIGAIAPPRLAHFLGSPESEGVRETVLDSVRDIFWQSFLRRVTFRYHRIGQLYRRRISLSDFLKPASFNGKLFCYKEPFLCFSAAHFATTFPNAKFIHIIRDGRDNADSLDRTYTQALSDEVLTSDQLSFNKNSEIGTWRTKDGFNYPWWVKEAEEAQFRHGSKYGRYIMMWREMVTRARHLKTMLPEDRYLEIHYEQFVQSPIEHGQRIRTFLGAEDSAAFRRKLNKAFSSSVNISKRNQEDTKRVESEKIAGDLLRELGYIED
ncbi:MAG: sulfotransferase [Bacteroidota bacterium]